jgi:hypothetical protein
VDTFGSLVHPPLSRLLNRRNLLFQVSPLFGIHEVLLPTTARELAWALPMPNG